MVSDVGYIFILALPHGVLLVNHDGNVNVLLAEANYQGKFGTFTNPNIRFTPL